MCKRVRASVRVEEGERAGRKKDVVIERNREKRREGKGKKANDIRIYRDSERMSQQESALSLCASERERERERVLSPSQGASTR